MPWLEPGQLGSRRVVSGPVERHRAGQRAVRQVDPSGHLPVTFPTSLCQVPAARPRSSSPASTVRCCTPRASTSATAGTTPKAPRRCSRSASGCPTRSSRFSGLQRQSEALDGVNDVHVSATITNVGKTAGRRRRSALPGRSGVDRRAAASAGRLPACRARPRAGRLGCSSRSPREIRGGGTTDAGGWTQSAGRYRRLRGRLLGTGRPAAPRRRSTSPRRRARGRWWSTPRARDPPGSVRHASTSG